MKGVIEIDEKCYNYGDIFQDGDRFLMIVSPEEALRICRDIQIWYYNMYSNEWRKDNPPEGMRKVFDNVDLKIWNRFTFAVEVEPPKPEYTPEQRSCDHAGE